MLKVLHVVGARPNFMKIAPVMRAMDERGGFEQILVHTGQHYDVWMSKVFFDDLGLPVPELDLGVGSGSHSAQTAGVMLAFEPALLEHRPDWVIVAGDVNSTLAAALVAAKMGTQVAHVEAGLRSFDRTMPEEVNRLLTDHLSEALFTHSREANENLAREGLPAEKVHFVGNTMIDTLVRLLPRTEGRPVLEQLGLLRSSGERQPFVLVTLHRPSNVDDPRTVSDIARALEEVARGCTVIFPVHPRTRARLEGDLLGVNLIEPLGYLDFLTLEQFASAVITDSGGIQEETTYLGVPCLTLRPNTERQITITEGTNRLVTVEELPEETATAIGEGSSGRRPPDLWDGRAAERIANVLAAPVGH
jgi:UDP-N-acetylglucosamine 2-epimerase (non-hydrolysing)